MACFIYLFIYFLDTPVWSLLLYPDLLSASFYLGASIDTSVPLLQTCPLDSFISQLNQYLTLACTFISPLSCCCASSPFPSKIRKRNCLQVAPAARDVCGLSCWELDIHFLGIHSNGSKFKFSHTLETLQRALWLRSTSLQGRSKASSGLWPWKMRVSYTKTLTSPWQMLSVFFWA